MLLVNNTFKVIRIACSTIYAKKFETFSSTRLLKGNMNEDLALKEVNKKFINTGTQHGTAIIAEDENIIVLSKSHSPERETTEEIVIKEEFDISNGNGSNPKIKQADEQVSLLTEKRKTIEEIEEIKRNSKKPKLESKYLKATRPGFSDDRYNETSYYFQNGLRKVYPYFFTFTTFAKGRWVGEKLLDVFSREFRAQPAEEFERCINAGTLTVNYEKVPADYELKHNDLLANIVHRHEVPVTCEPIKIVFMDNEIVAVNKPASIPVHPCGRYRHNTVVFILAKEFNLKNLRTIHRLDRLTSGLLLFSRCAKRARQMEYQIRNRHVQKQYVCRVEGEFPDGVIECKEPIDVVSYKIGICKVSPKGKECATNFERLSFDGESSVVLCKPLTGRMHQIRVHLQHLGHPIVNDPLYNHEVFGPNKGKGGDFGGKSDEQLINELISIHNAENWLGFDGDSDLPILTSKNDDTKIGEEQSVTEEPKEEGISYDEVETLTDRTSVATQTGHDPPDVKFNPEKMTTDDHCSECKVRYKDPKPKDLVMYLHAWKYKGPGWNYETDLPAWAHEDWKETNCS